MEVFRPLLKCGLILSAFFAISCSQKAKDVFPEAYGQGACVGSAYKEKSQNIHNRYVVLWKDGTITNEASESTALFLEKFVSQNLDKIKFIEYEKSFKISDEIKLLPRGVQAQAGNLDWGQNMIEAPAVWSQGYTGAGVNVAVVDTAVDYYHPNIFPNLSENIPEKNGTAGVDDDGNGYVDDVYGWDFIYNVPEGVITSDNEAEHGSHVAGIIAGDHVVGNVKGVAPQAKIIPAAFLDRTHGSIGPAINAINYSVSRGAKIINASWGGDECSEILKQTVAGLYEKNVLFVAASGNEGRDLDYRPEYPAAFTLASQLTISATSSTDRQTSWSNSSFNLVHISAPGHDIFSAIPGGYAYMSGTSMAAPMVSGAAALLFSVRPQATILQIKDAIMKSVDLNGSRTITSGRLNVKKAVEELKKVLP